MFAILPIFVVGASALTWILGSTALTGAGITAYYGGGWAITRRKEKGLLMATIQNGEDGFRMYCYDPQGLGCHTDKEVDLLWKNRGPRVMKRALTARIGLGIAQQEL